MTATVTSVTIAGPPVVNFKLATKQGAPVIGFGSKAANATTGITTYPNLAFSIAKLVPGSGGTPAKWVNYIVTTTPSKVATATCAALATCLQTPGTDNSGTLVDNGDGTYKYTFFRDVPGAKALVAGITPPANTATANYDKAALGDLTYDASLTHRVTIQISGNAPGTGTNTPNAVQVTPGVTMTNPVDAIYDFVPATGQAPAASAQRKMVDNANCESCHSSLGGIPGDSTSLVFHGGSRNTIDYCVICHTDQRRYGRVEATYNSTTRAFTGSTYVVDGRTVGTAPNFIHKIHMAGVMTRTGYNYGGVLFDQGGYSQDIRNCEKCHNPANASTPQAAQWKTNPNRVACGSCHDGINFDTGAGLTLADKAAGLTVSTGFFGAAHPANALDGGCTNSSCHGAGAGGDPDLVHRPVTPPNPANSLLLGGTNDNTNSAWIASNSNRLPAGAIKVAWDVKSISLDASRHPVMVFRWLQNDAPVAISTLAAATAAPNTATGLPEMWPNFMGSPSAYWVWSVPQDNVKAPVDFNASTSVYLRGVWNGSVTTGTLTGPDASGYYTVTRTDVVVPANARVFTGGMGYSYNVRTAQPLTQTSLSAYPVTFATNATYTGTNKAGGLIVIAPNKQVVATAGCVAGANNDYGCTSTGGFVARRAIVEDARCNSCHQELGTFTEDAFHAGQRNDGTTCSWCHTPNRTNQGWSIDSTYFIHAIHGDAKRTAKFTYDATSATTGFYDIRYPGVLARCEQCHVPGSYDFANAASADAVGLGADGIDKREFRTVGAGTYASASPTAYQFSPYVLRDNAYGSAPSYSAATGTITEGAATTLVISPTASVCTACHDTAAARSHMEANGGSFYQPRSVVFGGVWPPVGGNAPVLRTEQCVVCHASGKISDIKAVHAR